MTTSYTEKAMEAVNLLTQNGVKTDNYEIVVAPDVHRGALEELRELKYIVDTQYYTNVDMFLGLPFRMDETCPPGAIYVMPLPE